MKKINKSLRLLSLFLVVLMVSSLIVSCGKGKNEEETTTEGGSGNVSTTESVSGDGETEPIDYRTLMPEADYDGVQVDILYLDGRDEALFCDQEDKDTFGKEVALRNDYIEDKYNVDLNFLMARGESGFHSECNAAIMSGDSPYDIVMPDFYYRLETTGYFVNLRDYSSILKFDNPYWVSKWNDNATINGRLYSAVGYMGTDFISACEAIFCNEYVAKDLKLGNQVYEAVKNKTWTLETMLGMMKKNSSDVSGDGVWDTNDNYGLAYNLWGGRALLSGCGLWLSEFNDGMPEFTLVTDKNINVFDTVKAFLCDNEYCYYGGSGTKYDTPSTGDRWVFMNGRALFETMCLSYAKNLSQQWNAEGYGMYPMPMLDTDQEDYITPLRGSITQMIMLNAEDIEMSATILEAFNILSYTDLRTVYLDDMLKSRYSGSPQIAEMVDLIVDKVNVDFAYIF
ncbi:MAG: hypothetical protein ACI3XQ_08100, partial [Eubacteriales bacterium]